MLSRAGSPGSMLSPPLIALLLIANLIPAIVLMVLLSRRVAMARAARGGLGSGRLHTRLVALFSVIAAVPTVIVAIFASLAVPERARILVLRPRAGDAREYGRTRAKRPIDQEVKRVSDETVTMAGDVAGYLAQVSIDDPRFAEAFAAPGLSAQPLRSGDHQCRPRPASPHARRWSIPMTGRSSASSLAQALAELTGKPSVSKSIIRTGSARSRRSMLARALTSIRPACSTRSSASRSSRADEVLSDYRALLERSRANQLRFNARAAARRAGHRRPGDLHRAQARRPAGPPGRAAGRRRGPDRGRRLFDARAGHRRPRTKSARWQPPSTG